MRKNKKIEKKLEKTHKIMTIFGGLVIFGCFCAVGFWGFGIENLATRLVAIVCFDIAFGLFSSWILNTIYDKIRFNLYKKEIVKKYEKWVENDKDTDI
mgnify:CR=1 FL=1